MCISDNDFYTFDLKATGFGTRLLNLTNKNKTG